MSELEQKYKTALETIAGGGSWETLLATAALEKKSHSGAKAVLAFMRNNLAAIASLVIALSGVSFGILQYVNSRSQDKHNTKIARVEVIQKLIPTLTNENPNVRRYALAALLALYPAQDGTPDAETKELQALGSSIGGISDVETLEVFGRRLNDFNLMKRAAEIYTSRAQFNRYEAAKKETEKKYDEATPYYKAAWEDIQRAQALDSQAANTLYESGRLLMDYRQDYNSARSNFEQIIKLIEQNQWPKDEHIYLGSYLNRTRCLYLPHKQVNAQVCDYYSRAKSKYQEMQIALDIQQEDLEEIEKGCSQK